MNLICKHTVHLNCRNLCKSPSCRSSSMQPWSAVRAHRTSTCACVQGAIASYYPAFSTKGLISAPFADGCGLNESLVKVLRLFYLTVEDRFIERCPLLAHNLLSSLSPSRKSSPPSAAPAAIFFDRYGSRDTHCCSPSSTRVIIVRIIASARSMISCCDICVRYTSHG